MPIIGNNSKRVRPRPSGPPMLPEIETPEPMPMTAPGIGLNRMPSPYNRPMSRAGEIGEAEAAFHQKRPGRLKAGLLGALSGLGQGAASGDLGGAIGGAIGGFAGGAINPRGIRQRQFDQEIRPSLMERFSMEDRQRALDASLLKDQQDAEFQSARVDDIRSQIRTRETPKPIPRPSPIRSDRGLYDPETRGIIPGTEPLPAAPKAPPQSMKFGRNNKTGRFAWYNAADKLEASEHTPSAPAFAQPKSKAAAKPKKEQKFASITDVREYAQSKGISESQASVKFKEGGYTIVR